MGAPIIQFREAQEAIDFLRKRGVNPNEFGRLAFQAAIRRLRAQEAAEEGAQTKARLPKPVSNLVREGRDRR